MDKVRSNKGPIVFVVLLVSLLLFGLQGYLTQPTPTPDAFEGARVQEVREVFIDIDGDGRQDFLVRGEVILDRGGKISVLETPAQTPQPLP